MHLRSTGQRTILQLVGCLLRIQKLAAGYGRLQCEGPTYFFLFVAQDEVTMFTSSGEIAHYSPLECVPACHGADCDGTTFCKFAVPAFLSSFLFYVCF